MSTNFNQDLQILDYESVVDLLAQRTERFTQLLAEKNLGEEYELCKKDIEEIIFEIRSRQTTDLSQSRISFDPPDVSS